MAEHCLPDGLCMRRQPRQQRSQEVVNRIEQATLALLREQGFAALNTNAIAARAGVGIKSLYHLYPNKEAIICQLAMAWLAAVCEAQEAIREQADSGRPTVAAEPDGDVARIYKTIARAVAVKIAQQGKDFSSKFPTITISKSS